MTILLLLCVLVAALLPVVCAGIAKAGKMGQPRRDGGYDNHEPRAWLSQQTGYRARANAAQANSFEALPLFIGGIGVALALGGAVDRLAVLAAVWVALRAAYVGCYLADRATPRSLVWIAALGVNVAILFTPVFGR